jgi:hypothetical protein
VAAWVGGTPAAPVVQASAQPPGGTWSAPVTVGGDGGTPVIGIDGSGDAIIAWEGSTGTGAVGAIHTVSLPAGGAWMAVTTPTSPRAARHFVWISTAGALESTEPVS